MIIDVNSKDYKVEMYQTAGVQHFLENADSIAYNVLQCAVNMFLRGQYGSLNEEDKEIQAKQDINDDRMIMGVYNILGTTVWIMCEYYSFVRRVITILLPEEY